MLSLLSFFRGGLRGWDDGQIILHRPARTGLVVGGGHSFADGHAEGDADAYVHHYTKGDADTHKHADENAVGEDEKWRVRQRYTWALWFHAISIAGSG